MKEERQKTHWPESALIQEGCQGRGIHRRINLGQSRRHFLRILTAPDALGRGVLSLAPFHRGGASVGVPAEAPSHQQPARGGRTAEAPRLCTRHPPAGWGHISALSADLSTLSARQEQGRPREQEPATGWGVWAAGWGPSVTRERSCLRPAAPAALTLATPSWAPRVSAPVLRCLVSLSDKLNRVLFCKSPVFAQQSTSSGKTAGGGRACDQSVQVPRGPWGAPGDAVTWAEPQDLALDSEGSYSSLRLSFVK